MSWLPGPACRYSRLPAAIAALDAFFDLTWGEEGVAPRDDQWRPGAGKINAIGTLGAFFGELMRRQFGGEWHDDAAQPANPLMARVVLASGHEVFAIGKVYKRLKNGVEDRLEPLYRLVHEQSERRLFRPKLRAGSGRAGTSSA